MTTDSKNSWWEINGKDFIHDSEIMDVENLSKRYGLSKTTIASMQKKHGLKPKRWQGYTSDFKYKEHTKSVMASIPDMSDHTGDVNPTKDYNYHLPRQYPYNH